MIFNQFCNYLINNLIKIITLYFIFSLTLFSFSLDKKLSLDEKGLIGAHYNVPNILATSTLISSLYFGTTSRFGMTSFRSLNSLFISILMTETLKKTTGRLRPRHSDHPNIWLSKEKGNQSFVSGHVSSVTAMVASYVLEYKDDYPMVHALWLLTIHQMIGRVKAQAHWQSDVIAGAFVGFMSAYLDRKQDTPLVLYMFKNKMFIGLKYRFKSK